MKKITCNLLQTIFLWLSLFTVTIAALPARMFAQSFPPPGSLNDFSNTMIDTPNTAMSFDASDILDLQPEPDYAGTPAAVQPELPDTGPINYDGPIGVTGMIDNVTTGCSYSPLSHNALRGPITDIDVPGALGKYGLKMRRFYNSRSSQYWDYTIGLSPGWFHEYSWLMWSGGYKVISAQGNVSDDYCGRPVGISEWWEEGVRPCASPCPSPGTGTWRLADGGRVHFQAGFADYIEDPYGLRTTIARDANNRVSRVTEPGGRYLQFIYGTTNAYIDPAYGTPLLKNVEAYDGQGHLIERVTYTYRNVDSGGVIPTTGEHVIRKMLIGVAYDDNTAASYTYRTDNVPDSPTMPPYTFKFDPLLQTCNDKRYNGPMRQIAYEYQPLGPHGAIRKEYKPSGPLVSKIEPDLPLRPTGGWLEQVYRETRGDGPTRTFTYTPFKIYPQDPDPNAYDPCLDVHTNVAENRAPQQMLTDYTDFQGHTTHIGYDPSTWYVTSVTDANGNMTSYARGAAPPAGIGEILTITHPGGAHIDYTYSDDGHYIMSVRDENNKLTSITRDGNHRISQIDYPSDQNTPLSHEEFIYCDQAHADAQCGNRALGQLKRHRLKNNAYVHYRYDPRGLLIDKWEPTTNPAASDTEPHTHYDYYTAVDGNPGWIDRVKKMSMPANYPWNFQATQTYDHDRDATNQPSAGRGLVTKVTHTDGTFQASSYNQWGSKIHEWNELGERSDYAYDNYNRLTSVTRIMSPGPNEATSYDYAPTEADQAQAYKHTTNSPYWVTSPTAVKTHNVYDENFRKTSSSVAGRTTWFHYDLVGNQDKVTDPRGDAQMTTYTTTTQYDTRNRKWKVWDAQGHLTTFTYDGASNVIDILRADNTHKTKTYDALNRVLTDTVPKSTNPVVNLTTWFSYNPSGTIWKVTDARGSAPGDSNYTTTFQYDASDQKIKMTYPGGSFQSWAYDDAHNLKSRTTVNHETKYFAYDNRNRIYVDTWWDANAEWRYFGFDAVSRLRRAMNGPGQWYDGVRFTSDVHRSYNTAGRLTVDQQTLTVTDQTTIARAVNYEYDVTLRGGDGKPTRMYVPGVPGGGYDYAFRYDDMGRFEKIFRSGAPYFQYSYDNASNETQRYNNINQVNQKYDPDELNRTRMVELQYNGGPLAREVYDYYPIGRLHTVTRENTLHDEFGYYLNGELSWVAYDIRPTDGPDPNENLPADDPTKEKTVDDFLALPDGMGPDGVDTAARTVTYVYDKAGNRTWVADTGTEGNKVYTPNTINQYINNVGSDPITNGPEHEVASYENVSYRYLKDEHLMEVSSVNPNNSYQLTYDALGRCVKRTINGVTKYYIYDGERPILEYNPSGGLVGYNLYGKGVDEILMRYDPTLMQEPRTFYYQQNHEGSVTHLTYLPPTGVSPILEYYRYDVFGKPTVYGPPPNWPLRTASLYSNRFLFTGREWSALFGFYEYRARAYHPGLGRFMSEDPKLFEAGDYNLFRYCHNDPIDFTDPMGLDGVSFNDHFNYFIQSPALDRNFLRGSFINVISKPSLSQQCAKGAQFMAGTVLKDGLHGVPTTHTAMGKPQWFQGPPVGPNTNGMLVARGFINGVYPSLSPEQTPKGQIVNHVGIQTGLDKGTGMVQIFDQWKGQPLGDNRYNARSEGWYVVLIPKGAGSYTKQSNDLVPTAQPNRANAAGEIISNILHGLNPKLP